MSIQAQINAGYGIAASVLGTPCPQYRATSPANPLSTQIGTLQAAFDVDPKFSFAKPSAYGKAFWYGLFDPTNCLVGDYLVGPAGTFFIASIEPLHPTECVQCNHVLSFTRPTSNRALGRVHGLDGDTRSTETPTMTGWPASLLQGTKGEKPDTGIPGEARDPWFAVLLPAVTGVSIDTDDITTDENGNRYQISSTELTPKGWRLSMELADG